MEDPPAGPRTRRIVALALLAGVLGGGVGAGMTAWLVWPDAAPPPAAEVIAALGAGGEDADRVALVAEAVLPSVVRIDVRGLGAGVSGNASGVVIDADGHVVTNHHVVAGATEIVVTLAGREQRDAVLVGSDPRNDLAVVRIEDGDLPPPVRLADGGTVRVGQLAVVLGSPYGLDGSVSAGIVSAVDRPVDLRGPDGAVIRLPGVIQTDAAVSPGNSGGPLVDARGALIGVTSAVLAEPFGGGVGFAIPVSLVTAVVEDLIAGGRVAHPHLGLAGTTLPSGAATALGVDAGVVVDRVAPDGPAEAAGIRPGDVVVAVDGDTIRGMDDLVAAVRAAGVGATIDLDIVRDGTMRTASADLVDADHRED